MKKTNKIVHEFAKSKKKGSKFRDVKRNVKVQIQDSNL